MLLLQRKGPGAKEHRRPLEARRGKEADSLLRLPEETSPADTVTLASCKFLQTRTWEQPRGPLTEKWIKQKWCIHTMEYYSAIKRNKIGSFVEMWMNLEGITQSEVRKRKTNIIH